MCPDGIWEGVYVLHLERVAFYVEGDEVCKQRGAIHSSIQNIATAVYRFDMQIATEYVINRRKGYTTPSVCSQSTRETGAKECWY